MQAESDPLPKPKSKHGEEQNAKMKIENVQLLFLCSRSHGLLQHLTVTARL